MELNGITRLCMRERDVNVALLAKFSDQNQITVNVATCPCCGEKVIGKDLKGKNVICSHCA